MAMAGFAAVHAALRGSTGPRGTFRAWGTVSWAFTAVLLALIPPLIGTSRPLDAEAWRLIHLIGFFPAALSMATSIWLDVRLNAAGHVAQIALFLRIAQVMGVSGCLILLAALAGWPTGPTPATYAVVVFGLFFSAVVGILASFWLAMHAAIGMEEDEA